MKAAKLPNQYLKPPNSRVVGDLLYLGDEGYLIPELIRISNSGSMYVWKSSCVSAFPIINGVLLRRVPGGLQAFYEGPPFTPLFSTFFDRLFWYQWFSIVTWNEG